MDTVCPAMLVPLSAVTLTVTTSVSYVPAFSTSPPVLVSTMSSGFL